MNLQSHCSSYARILLQHLGSTPAKIYWQARNDSKLLDSSRMYHTGMINRSPQHLL